MRSNTKGCTYKVTYKGDKHPPYYIGSSYEEKVLNENYMGSPTSKKWADIVKQEMKDNPHLYTVTVLKITDTRLEATEFELELQKINNVVKNDDFWNEAFATVNGFFGRDVSGELHPRYGKPHTEESKIKMSEGRADISGENSHWFGKSGHSEESKKKISDNHSDVSGENNPMWGKDNSGVKNGMYGRHHTEETKKLMSKSKKGKGTGINNPNYGKQETKECPYCGLVGGKANMKRYHFDNCKNRPESLL